MSQFLPRSAVAKENLMQVARRVRLENRLVSNIKLLKEDLKTKSTVIPELLELGLTRKHAVAVEMRLQWELEAEEEKVRRKAEKEARARAEAEKANQEAAPAQGEG